MNKKLISLLVVTAFGCMTIKSEEQPQVTRKDSTDIKKVPFLNRLFNGKNNKSVASQTQQTETASKN